MAFVFGPFLPVLFLYAFVGMIILDTTIRLRVAYSVKRFPKYSADINLYMLFLLRYFSLFYCVSAGAMYSNQ